jgi:hypothetical protein
MDDTRASLLTGCLLRLLFAPRPKLLTLTAPLRAEAASFDCTVGLHVRFGDKFMYRFTPGEGSPGGGGPDQSDERVSPVPENVMKPLRCALSIAMEICRSRAAEEAAVAAESARSMISPDGEAPWAAGDVSVPEAPLQIALYIATDTPESEPWFDASASLLQQENRLKVSTLKLLRSNHGPPGHVGAFSGADPKQRLKAEEQLFADFFMLSRCRAVISSGSILSYTAASFAGQIPIRAGTCQPDWL